MTDTLELAPVNLEKSTGRFNLYWDCCEDMREVQDKGHIYTDEDCISCIRVFIEFDKGKEVRWANYCPFCGKRLYSDMIRQITDRRVKHMVEVVKAVAGIEE